MKKVRYIGKLVVLAVALLVVTGILPAAAAQVKPLDDLEKMIFLNAVKDKSSRSLDSAAELQQALDTLNSGDEISSVPSINKAQAQLALIEKLLAKASADLRDLTGYVSANKEKLSDADVTILIPLAELDDPSYRRYEEAVKSFVVAFESMARHAKENISALRAGRKVELDQYDNNYRLYVAAVDALSEAAAVRSQFVERFTHGHPKLGSYVQK